MASTLPSAVSPDGRLVAIVSPTSSSSRLRIQIYQVTASTSSCSLQQTLTHHRSSDVVTQKTEVSKLLFLSNSSNFLAAFLKGGEEVVIWDLTRGVVSETLTPSSPSVSKSSRRSSAGQDAVDDAHMKFLDLAVPITGDNSASTGSTAEPEFYVLASSASGKLYAMEYRGSRLIRKIKSGKYEGDDVTSGFGSLRLAVTSGHVLVHSLGQIRVMDRRSGSKAGKIKLKNAPATGSPFNLVVCPTHPTIAVTLHDMGSGGSTGNSALGVYDISTCKPVVEQFLPSSSFQGISTDAVLQLLGSGNSKSVPSTLTVLVNQALYDVKQSAEKSASAITELSRVVTAGDTQKSGPVALNLLVPSKKLLVLQYPNARRGEDGGNSSVGGECTCRLYSLDDGPSSLPDRIDLSLPLHQQHETSSSSLKRGGSQVSTMILGPGQAGIESRNATVAAPPAKKAKVGKDDDEANAFDDADSDEEENAEKDEVMGMTIAERLEKLTETMDEGEYDDLDDEEDSENEDDEGEETKKRKTDVVTPTVTKFVPKKATTESLVELLTQALSSNDDTLLELALSVRDSKVITRTLQELQPPSLLTALLSKLTTRLASSPMRAQALVTWLSPCLKQAHILQNDGTLLPRSHINALRNLLHERMESFQDLLRLEGRLSMMCE